MIRVLARLPSVAMKLDLMQGAVLDDRRPRHLKASFAQSDIVTLDLDDGERRDLEEWGAVIYEDAEFHVAPGTGSVHGWASAGGNQGILSLADVLEEINAPRAWPQSRGRGVTIAVVDTGIDLGLSEIESARRSPVDLPTAHRGQHWSDPQGHGSMCAAIAAGAQGRHGRYDGVAAEATVLSARSTLKSSDLLDIYDELLRARDQGRIAGPLVINNSYALRTCSPPQILPQDHPFIGSVLTAVDRGVFICFAAGNNHHDPLCGHDPAACAPNTIWGPNSHDRIVSVGTVNRERTNRDPATPHIDSSRGPGEWARETVKPDCVAPTYGEVPWGAGYRTMDWWGTSGACPQVAGLAALLLSVDPTLEPADIADLIRKTCVNLPHGTTCVGHGLIDCAAAVQAALVRRIARTI